MRRTERGNPRFKRAVTCGSCERRFHVEGGTAVFEDHADMGGDRREWYKTGENEREEGKGLEETPLAARGRDFGMTLYKAKTGPYTKTIGMYISMGSGILSKGHYKRMARA
ncbi:MAG: hypothetical protein LBB48_02930 [Treponema sp.]|jgi:hypothetical protein|nr:hypothetical protein [Treponema sp.]